MVWCIYLSVPSAWHLIRLLFFPSLCSLIVTPGTVRCNDSGQPSRQREKEREGDRAREKESPTEKPGLIVTRPVCVCWQWAYLFVVWTTWLVSGLEPSASSSPFDPGPSTIPVGSYVFVIRMRSAGTQTKTNGYITQPVHLFPLFLLFLFFVPGKQGGTHGQRLTATTK